MNKEKSGGGIILLLHRETHKRERVQTNKGQGNWKRFTRVGRGGTVPNKIKPFAKKRDKKKNERLSSTLKKEKKRGGGLTVCVVCCGAREGKRKEVCYFILAT